MSVERLLSQAKVIEAKKEQMKEHFYSQMQQSTLGDNKISNNKIVYEKLKRDMHIFFEKNQYYVALNSAASETKYRQKDPAATRGKNIIINHKPDPISPANNVYGYEKSTPIKLMGYIKMMHSMGFINLKRNSSECEELLTELWKMVGGTDTNAIRAENLLTVLSAVMNLPVNEVMPTHTGNKSAHMRHKKKGMLCFDQGGACHLTSE